MPEAFRGAFYRSVHRLPPLPPGDRVVRVLCGPPVPSSQRTAHRQLADAGPRGRPRRSRTREVGHAGRDINDRYTHVLIEAHLAAAEQTAALIREAGKTAP